MWTQISLDERSFDRKVRVRLRGQRPPNPEIVFPAVALMLLRSGKAPIELRINVPDVQYGRPWFTSIHTDLLRCLLLPHVARIASFEFTSSVWKNHAYLLDLFRGERVPLLRSVALSCQFQEDQEFELDFPKFTSFEGESPIPFADASNASFLYPSLKELSLLGINCPWRRYAGGNLTKITIARIPFAGRPTAKQLCSLLDMSKDTLKVLEIDGALPYKEVEDNITVEMRQLETLKLFYTTPRELSVFVNHIRAPAVKYLEIGNINHDLTPAVDAQTYYADTVTAFERILQNYPVEQILEVTMSDVQFGPGGLGEMCTRSEPLEFLRRLEKGVRKMRFKRDEDLFSWDAGEKSAERALAAWRLEAVPNTEDTV